MNKYSGIFVTAVKQEKKTMSNTFIAMLSFCVIILIFNQLWRYIYTNGISMIINGYDLNMMLWYLIMAEVLTFSLSSKNVTRSFAGDIKTGKIAYSLNKPYNYFMYQLVSSLANLVWKMIFMVPTGFILGYILLGEIKGFMVYYIFPVILSLLFAAILGIVVYGMIGLLAFWIEEPRPFTWIVQKFILLFGLFFPPEFFPEWLQPFIIYSPIFAMMSGPCKLLANFSWELFGNVILSQTIYIVIFFSIGMLVYNSGTRKVNINGG